MAMATEATKAAQERADANRLLVAQVVRAALRDQGLNQERFAAEAGVTKQVVSKWAGRGAEIPSSILAAMQGNPRQWVRDMADEIVNIQYGHLLAGVKED